MKTIITSLFLLIAFNLCAQNLKVFTGYAEPDSSFIILGNGKILDISGAEKVKDQLDLGLVETKSEGSSTLEWYNMDPVHEKFPARVSGTKTKIAAITFDRDQFDKCKTAADLQRMTGYLSINSFSHFAVLKNNLDTYQHCFVFQKENGKRGLIFMTPQPRGKWKVEVKIQP